MNCYRVDHRETGLTLLEVLVILVSLGILLLLLMPSVTNCKQKAPRVKCTAGLKQVALGFVLWANENEGKFPMEAPISAGGTKEHALAGNLLPNFTVAANQIQDPRVLICPSDEKRKPATSFTNLTLKNITYFLNVDAAFQNQAHILAGDRDIATNGSPVRPGLLPIPDPDAISWASIIHKNGGNVALVDGSVHQVTVRQLRTQLTTGITNRLIIP